MDQSTALPTKSWSITSRRYEGSGNTTEILWSGDNTSGSNSSSETYYVKGGSGKGNRYTVSWSYGNTTTVTRPLSRKVKFYIKY